MFQMGDFPIFVAMQDVKEIFAKAQSLLEEIKAKLPSDAAAIETFRIEYLGTKGKLKLLMAAMKDIPNDQKKEYGQLVNKVKHEAEHKLLQLQEGMSSQADTKGTDLDLTIPGNKHTEGARHPLSIVRNEIVDVFGKIGFTVFGGPEIEDDWHNFTALNTPEDHPARDMQDTYYLQTDPVMVLRTHTSPAQIRALETNKLPVRIITPGRVYRNETISARAHCFFHQIEGLYVDENVSFVDLKQTLYYFAKQVFGQDIEIRFRPSYFPFTEPSAEMDITCLICKGKGCSVCKQSGWVEILGCGMVDPNVLENCKIDPDKYTGFAFGMGIERITMLKYRINDLRLFSENDVRFLKQFANAN